MIKSNRDIQKNIKSYKAHCTNFKPNYLIEAKNNKPFEQHDCINCLYFSNRNCGASSYIK